MYNLLETVIGLLSVELPTEPFDISRGSPGQLAKENLKDICTYVMEVVTARDPVVTAADLKREKEEKANNERIARARLPGDLFPRGFSMTAPPQEGPSVRGYVAEVTKVIKSLTQHVQLFPEETELKQPFELYDRHCRQIIKDVATFLTHLIHEKWKLTVLPSANLKVWFKGLIDIIKSKMTQKTA